MIPAPSAAMRSMSPRSAGGRQQKPARSIIREPARGAQEGPANTNLREFPMHLRQQSRTDSREVGLKIFQPWHHQPYHLQLLAAVCEHHAAYVLNSAGKQSLY